MLVCRKFKAIQLNLCDSIRVDWIITKEITWWKMSLQSELQTSSKQRATVCIEYNAKFHFGRFENTFHFKDPINVASLTRETRAYWKQYVNWNFQEIVLIRTQDVLRWICELWTLKMMYSGEISFEKGFYNSRKIIIIHACAYA